MAQKFQKGNPGKAKGCQSKNNRSLKQLLHDVLGRNRPQCLKMMESMLNDKTDFKWLMQLKASLEPREIDHSGSLVTQEKIIIVRYEKEIIENKTQEIPGRLPLFAE